MSQDKKGILELQTDGILLQQKTSKIQSYSVAIETLNNIKRLLDNPFNDKVDNQISAICKKVVDNICEELEIPSQIKKSDLLIKSKVKPSTP